MLFNIIIPSEDNDLIKYWSENTLYDCSYICIKDDKEKYKEENDKKEFNNQNEKKSTHQKNLKNKKLNYN